MAREGTGTERRGAGPHGKRDQPVPRQTGGGRQQIAVSSRTSVGMGARQGMGRAEREWSRSVYPTDRYGRTYHVVESTQKGGGPMSIIPLFKAPIVPPPDCQTIDPKRPWRVDINFRKWMARVMADTADTQNLRRMVKSRTPRGEDLETTLAEKVGPDPGEYRSVAGYSSNVELIALAYHGDPWCLGRQKERTAKVISVIGEEEPVTDIDFLLGEKYGKEIAAILGPSRVEEEPEPETDEDLEQAAIAFAERQSKIEAGELPVPAIEGFDVADDATPDSRSSIADLDQVARFGVDEAPYQVPEGYEVAFREKKTGRVRSPEKVLGDRRT
jgi:hypothetical protein